jgi:guanylate kinase
MSNIKQEKIILTGPSGSGKDFLLRGLIKKELKYSPKFTTRPKRYLERDGIEYNFIDNQNFEELQKEKKIKVYQSFLIGEDTWYYGVTKENFDNNQLFIMTPHEISQLSEEDLKGCFLVYLDIDMDIRRKRISNRNDNNDSIERRLQADEIDFKNFKNYDLKVTDSEFEAEWVYDLMN